LNFNSFFGEAANAGNVTTGRPALEVGDVGVTDNRPTHYYAGGEALQEWLEERNVELVYTPTYLPDFNPVEFIFNKMCTVTRNKLQGETISSSDMVDFVRYTSYIDI